VKEKERRNGKISKKRKKKEISKTKNYLLVWTKMKGVHELLELRLFDGRRKKEIGVGWLEKIGTRFISKLDISFLVNNENWRVELRKKRHKKFF
jgi:hypothetical protein